MVNKTTSFKKKGKGKKKGNFKKNSKQVVAQEKKPKSGPKPETKCFYCKGTGHCKRNCPKYLADKKDGKVKGIFYIHVIDVYLTNARSSTWVFDTGSVANICNSKQGLWIKRRLAKDEVTMRVENGSKVDVIAVGTCHIPSSGLSYACFHLSIMFKFLKLELRKFGSLKTLNKRRAKTLKSHSLFQNALLRCLIFLVRVLVPTKILNIFKDLFLGL